MTQAQLLALPYENSASSKGILADDYRKEFREHGERVRHFKCFPKAPENMVGPNGEKVERDENLYIESLMSAEVKVLISATDRMVMDAEFGQFMQGQTSIACLPDEVELARYDRVILVERRVLRREAFAPSGNARDELGNLHVAEIVDISEGEAVLEREDDGSSFLRWMSAPPPLCRVEYHYHPQFIFLDVGDKNPPLGADRLRLPQRGILTLENRKG